MKVLTGVDKLRSGHEETIEDNPQDITIERTERVREGGGFRERESTVGTVRARLYQEATGRSGAQEVVTIAGEKQIDARWGLLCYAEMKSPDGATVPTEIRAGAHVLDTFTDNRGDRYEIVAVYPRQDRGTVWGWQAVVQKIH